MGTPLWIRPKRMMYSLLLALILVACVFAKDDHARVFGPGKDFGSFEESGTLSSTSSTSSSSTSSSSSSDEDRSRRAERDHAVSNWPFKTHCWPITPSQHSLNALNSNPSLTKSLTQP